MWSAVDWKHRANVGYIVDQEQVLDEDVGTVVVPARQSHDSPFREISDFYRVSTTLQVCHRRLPEADSSS
jgi:hypothetical protein